ncbi:putative conserved protein [Rhizobium favelukesii]|uniref:Conserved protein n=1 Tax=Rhizobium favelukesii TaxID=348824 RepID=W6R7K9_9HYPH|nr:putative conserved protein [Rhizobium favelukesii]
MIDHITIAMSDLQKSKLFYESAFASLGYKLSFGKVSVFWAFAIGGGSLFEIQQADSEPPLTRLHVALRARRKTDVDPF